MPEPISPIEMMPIAGLDVEEDADASAAILTVEYARVDFDKSWR